MFFQSTKMAVRKYIPFFVLMFMFVSCEYDFPEDRIYSDEDFGEINTEKFISVGDGYLAGTMDGALYSAGQQNSVASILASQFSIVNEQSFLQPDINSENGFNLYIAEDNTIYGKWIYRYANNTDEDPKLVLSAGENITEYSGDKNVLNNLAIPQLYVNQITSSNPEENPFYSRTFLENGESIVDQVVQKSPSFVLSWLGINDYLNYAMSGATNPDDFTTIDDFQNNYTLYIEKLIQNTESKIVIGNLVSIEDLPFFYLRQYDFIRLTNKELGAVQGRYSTFNEGVVKHNVGLPEEEKRPFISYYDNGTTLYPQPVVVKDESLSEAYYPDGTPLEKYRQLAPEEMALFSITDKMVENGLGWLVPLDKEYYLTVNQSSEIIERIHSFNQLLNEFAEKYPDRILLVDIASEVKKIADTGKFDSWGFAVSDEIVFEDGVPLEGGLGMNSIFSLDAFHFNQRGNAFITNLFIREINSSFKAKIPFVNVNNYIGNVYIYQ